MMRDVIIRNRKRTVKENTLENLTHRLGRPPTLEEFFQEIQTQVIPLSTELPDHIEPEVIEIEWVKPNV